MHENYDQIAYALVRFFASNFADACTIRLLTRYVVTRLYGSGFEWLIMAKYQRSIFAWRRPNTFMVFLFGNIKNKRQFSWHKCFIIECGYQSFGGNIKGNRFEVGSKLTYEGFQVLVPITCTDSGDWVSQYSGNRVCKCEPSAWKFKQSITRQY